MRSAECSACPIRERKEVESRESISISRPIETRLSFGSDAALARAKESRITVEGRLHSENNERKSRSFKRPRPVTIQDWPRSAVRGQSGRNYRGNSRDI